MSCPQCATELENYSRCEGGWCPKCEEWFPSDIVEEHLAEQFPQEEDFFEDHLTGDFLDGS